MQLRGDKTTKSWRLALRKWHKWAGLGLCLPILTVGITAVFLAHGKRLDLEKVFVSAAWLPGYSTMLAEEPWIEIRSSYFDEASGRMYVGAKNGLYQIQDGIAEPVGGMQHVEIRRLVKAEGHIFAAGKQGIYRKDDNNWEQLFTGDVHDLHLTADGALYAAVKDRGLLVSLDLGSHWSVADAVMSAVKTIPIKSEGSSIPLQKLIIDLHTGKALLGKNADWIWIDIISLAIVFLTLTGVYVWWRGHLKGRQAKRRKAPRKTVVISKRRSHIELRETSSSFRKGLPG